MAAEPGTPRGQVVVVDDEPSMLRIAQRLLKARNFTVVPFSSANAALEHLRKAPPDVIVSDLHMPEMSGVALLSAAREICPETPVILMTGNATLDSAIDALRLGAYDYVLKPFSPTDLLVIAIERAFSHHQLVEDNRMLHRRLRTENRYEHIVGSSQPIRDVLAMVTSVARTDATVLIQGESGTGKELVAQAIHRDSARSARAFVTLNCGALTETVLESELFGHERGAFTGAVSTRRGLFEEASGGTLMLDEVGELTPATQVRLLRVLQEGQIRRVGSNEVRSVDVRVIAATHRDLHAEVQEGRFRQDLLFRLDVVRIRVPPLRERLEDLPLLVRHFVDKHAQRHGTPVSEISDDAIQLLMERSWPGNVRELANTVERAVVMSKSSRLEAAAFRSNSVPPPPTTTTPAPASRGDTPHPGGDVRPLADERTDFEQRYCRRVMELSEGNVTRAADLAGVDRSNFRRLLKRHGIGGGG
jgi:two-component system, NtrC family, response regulator HydG